MKAVFVVLFLLSGQLFYAQQTQLVDFKSLKGEVTFTPKTKSIKGQLTCTFKIKQSVDSVFLDAKNMEVSLSKNSPLKAKVRVSDKKIWLIHSFRANKSYTIRFSYHTENPKKTLYFVGWDNKGSNQMWTQGQGHHTSYWLPSIDDKNDKIIFDLTYKIPKAYQLIANGQLIDHHTKGKQGVWHYKMTRPMSSYLVAVAVGNYRHKTLTSTGGIPIALYYEPKDSAKVEPTYRYSLKIFDDMEDEIGVAYPWETYKQIPVRDFLYAGMENTTATIFSESFMTDSIGFIDRNYVNVNAHELAHQWFGDLVTEKSSKSHWLQEGFATYYALLAEKEIFGKEDYYFKLYKSAERLKAQSDKGKGRALTDPEAGSLTFYQKGAWALHILREKIGDKAFKTGIKSYLKTYKFQNAGTDDFIKEMEKSSGQELTNFVENWLNQSAFQAGAALTSLRKSEFIGRYLDLAALQKKPLADKFDRLNEALDFPVDNYLGQEVVHQLARSQASDQRLKLYKKAFATNNTLVRQAIAMSLDKIPESLQSDYESLLKDRSYLTQEKALFNLWKNFPSSRKSYLNQLQNVQGFYDKNVRMMWLTLALVTQDYHPGRNTTYFEELSGYTAPAYDYSIRQNAFGHLYQINTFTIQNYKDLLQACVHPVWRFRKFARELLDNLLKENHHRDKLQRLKPQLPEKQQHILANALKKTTDK